MPIADGIGRLVHGNVGSRDKLWVGSRDKMGKDRFRQKEVCQAQTYLGGDDGQHYRVLIITKEEIQIRIVIFREKTFGIFTRIISSPPPAGTFCFAQSPISPIKNWKFFLESELSRSSGYVLLENHTAVTANDTKTFD